ncbi:translocation/assembly module TamB domain-containing protein [Idiomarina sp. HP20-50]|uniref:translocation/assembly module TamB domain-containing protein n=1 Tax=Idiomarina sp. HP20-50 TaxID=3070813 RepID=UPI00294AAA79|nr:translocation/assembly module TamB domain-containing protein [Idiomarina sp. HP20-50]MDV6317122.1 translocation/assembly module TamB domain-containing protein [Idiomarina sp. HP20-50]
MSFYRWFASIILILIFIIPAIAISLVASETGSRWLLSQGQKYLPVDIRYDEFSGTLLNEFQFEGFVFEADSFSYTPKRLKVDWQPLALLSGTLHINKIESIQGEVRVRASEKQSSAADSDSIKNINIELPLRIELTQLLIRDSRFFILGNPAQELDISASAIASASGRLNLKRFHLEHQYLTTSISGTTQLAYPFKSKLKNDTQFHSPDYPKLTIVSQISGDIETLITESTFSESLNGTLKSKINNPLKELRWRIDSQWQQNQLNGWLKAIDENELTISFNGSLKGHGTLNRADLNPDLTVGVNGRSTDVNGDLHYQNHAITFDPILIKPKGEVTGEFTLTGNVSSLTTSPVVNATLAWNEVTYQPSEITSDNGKLIAAGSLDNLAIQLSSKVSGLLEQEISVVADAQLKSDKLSISGWKLSQQKEQVKGTAVINWQDGIAVSSQFSGNYQQKPVDGDIDFRIVNPYLFVEQFSARWGKQSLTAQGSLSPGNQLNWKLLSDNLGTISSINGSASAAGSIAGALNRSELKVDVNQFQLQPANYEPISLKQPVTASINYQDFTFQISPVCMTYTGLSAPFCLKAEQQGALVIFQTNADKVPLGLVQSLTLPNAPYKLNGHLSINIDGAFNYREMALEELSGFINADNSGVNAAGESITFDQLKATAESKDKRGITLQLFAKADELGLNLDGQLDIAHIASDSPISGNVHFSSKSLEPFNLLFPQVDIEDGHANTVLDIAGRLNNPSVSGEITLSANQVVLLPTGTLISDLQANLTANANAGQFTINADGKVGAGDVVIQGQLNAFSQTGLLTIRGNDLLVLDTPSLMLMASPDISVELEKDLISVTGDLTVPKALVTPLEFNQAVTVSDDVVLKNEERQKSLLKTKVDVTVNLGKNVRLEALGFTGNLQGKLQITRQPNSIARGTGRIGVVSGKYEIYGQKLTIENGDLIFNGGPLYSPSLNLRVTRNIEQTAFQQDVPEKIGARVTGTIEQPELTLFSTPPLPDSTILSYLLFGKPPGSQGDVNNLELQAALLVGGRGTEFLTEEIKSTFDLDEVALESTTNDINDTSLYIGKYLSPRLYIKYGIGLLESTSTFIIRYSLTENLLFESKSTTESQGGDLIYTIEN